MKRKPNRREAPENYLFNEDTKEYSCKYRKPNIFNFEEREVFLLLDCLSFRDINGKLELIKVLDYLERFLEDAKSEAYYQEVRLLDFELQAKNKDKV